MRLEEADEMLGIVEAEALAYRRDGQCIVIQELLGAGEEMTGDDVLGGTAGLCLDQ